MTRDDFSKQTLDALARRVGVRYSNPSCRKPTTGPRTEPHRVINIGVGAHITAAASRGPRYDPSLTAGQRQSPENGIWLCQNCAKLIDNDPSRYPVEMLRDWKAQAEASALAAIEGSAESQPTDLSAEVELSYTKERIESKRHDYRLQVTLTNLGTEPLGPYHIDLEMPARVVHRAEDQPPYVRDRSTRDVAFFRINHREEIYPGDTKLVMSVDYYVDQEIYFHSGDLFDRPVRATLYRPGIQPFTLERRFGEFQIF